MTVAAIFIYPKWKQSGPQCCHPHGAGSPFCPKISRKTKFYKKYFPQFLGHHTLEKKDYFINFLGWGSKKQILDQKY